MTLAGGLLASFTNSAAAETLDREGTGLRGGSWSSGTGVTQRWRPVVFRMIMVDCDRVFGCSADSKAVVARTFDKA